MDRISSLPNELLCHIASFLSAKEAAFALVLSKRWSNLFTIIPNLHFSDLVEKPGDFTELVDRLVALPSSSRIRKLTLLKRLRLVESAYFPHLDHCLCNVLKRGILELELDIKVAIDSFDALLLGKVDDGERSSLPVEVFTCKTLVVLKLGADVVVDLLPENAFLPALKNLILDSVRFYDHCGSALETLLSACPVLEDLVIRGVNWEFWNWSRIVSSPTLQRLTINKRVHCRVHFRGSKESITFDTPNLVYLEYCDIVTGECPFVNLDSLVEAKLHLVMTTSNTTNLFMVLKNVQILTILSPRETFQAFHYFSEAIPMFENVRRLSIAPNIDHDGYCMMLPLPLLLEKFPNLETFECSLHDQYSMLGYSFRSSCPVKILEITEYDGTSGELEQMRCFLGNFT